SAGVQQRLGDRAIDDAGVEMAIAVMLGKPLAQRAFARCRGSVDSNDHTVMCDSRAALVKRGGPAACGGQPVQTNSRGAGGLASAICRESVEAAYGLACRTPRARRSGRSSVKILRDENSPGLLKVRY